LVQCTEIQGEHFCTPGLYWSFKDLHCVLA